MNFRRSVIRILLLLAPIVPCFGQSSADQQALTQKEVGLLVDSLSAVLNRWYIYPDKGKLMANKIKANYKNGGYNKLKTRSELALSISHDLLLTHKDLHMKVGYFPEASKEIEKIKSESEEKTEREHRLKESKENYFGFIEKKIYPGNVGYLRWDRFDEFAEEGLPVFDSSFKSVSKCDVVIIDMRYNTGGNPYMADALQNYFFERRTPLNYIIDRRGDTVKRFTVPAKTSFKLSMPLYILTDSTTFSAAEDFTYTHQQSKRAILVGATTGGGAHPSNVCSLGQGFIISVPTKRSFNVHSKTDWEGTGIIPDISTPSEEALNEALLFAYKKLLPKATGEKEKKAIQSGIHDVKSRKYASLPFSTAKNNDAVNAIEIEDSVYGPANVCFGEGASREYHEKTSFLDHGATVFINEEHSAWFKIKFTHDTLLTFDLVPTDPSNDYDFIFFKCSDAACIEDIKTGKRKPERSCHSGYASYNGATGISRYGFDGAVGIGPGPTYVSAIPVKAGEVYYLMVNYGNRAYKENNLPRGFTIYFHDNWPRKKPVILENVNFNTNEALLLPGSFSELDKLVAQLLKDKTMSIEVRGHADSEGNEAKNMELSIARAQVVKDYLLSKQIDPKRVYCKGFGSSKPLASNETEEGKRKNRRVEFSLIMR